MNYVMKNYCRSDFHQHNIFSITSACSLRRNADLPLNVMIVNHQFFHICPFHLHFSLFFSLSEENMFLK